jgi:hypothetical protein
MAKFKTVYNPRTKTKSVVAFTAADSDEFVAAISKKEERATKLTTKDSDGTFELMHQGSTKLKTDAAGVIVSGTVTGTTFSGSGASLTNLNASKLSSGTVPSARLSLSASDIPNLATSKITSGTFDAARIPSLNASKITAGTIDSDRLPTGTFGGGGGGSTSPGGSNTQVQFNNSGSFGGDAGLTFNATSNDLTVSGKVNAATVDLGNWTITESSGVLYFATGGTNKMKLDASGNLTVVGNVTAYGTM